MALKIGNNAVTGAYLGANQVRRAYKGGSLVFQAFSPASEQEFVQMSAPGGPAQLLKCYGKSIVNNQQAPEFSATYWVGVGVTDLTFTSGEVSFTPDNDGLSSYITIRNAYPISNISGHKYFFAFDAKKDVAGSITVRFGAGYINRSFSATTTYARYAAIVASTGSGYNTNNWICGQVAGVKTYIKNFVFIDLTLRFGAGNEPTSVDEALRLLGGDAFDPTYDPGSLQSNKTSLLRAERIPVINVWDEEWEVGLLDSSGAIGAGSRICSSNYIPVQDGATYAMRYGGQLGGRGRAAFYDENYNLVQYYADFPVSPQAVGGINVGEFVVPTGAKYMRFCTSSSYITTYNHDICINLSDPAINGTYFPHWRGSLQLNLSTLTGKLNGEGASVVVYPDGLRGVGTDRDAAYGSTGEVARAVVDLGALNWVDDATNRFMVTNFPAKYLGQLLCPILSSHSGTPGTMPDKSIAVTNSQSYPILRAKDSAYTDAATFKAAMSGVMLDYPLATPLTYTLDTPLPTDLTCEQGDILQRVSDNNCPFVGEMKFGL